ncbi:MAG: protein kinase domain-containing protein [Verrucomicrobiales bacterium]
MTTPLSTCPNCHKPRATGGTGSLCAACSAAAGTVSSDAAAFMLKDTISDSSPSYFGEYKVERLLGRGGMGVVYLARHERLERYAAIKMLLDVSPRNIARFMREAEAVSRLTHPNILHFNEFGETDDGEPYIILPYVSGGNLVERQKDFSLADLHKPIASGLSRSSSKKEFAQRAAKVAQLMLKITEGISFAHKRLVLHRDLKPENILLDTADNPFISDFGLAKFIDEMEGMTRTMEMAGTPGYMSPEQASGKLKDVTVATDVYGLGAILYFLLSGKAPFTGSPMQILAKLGHEDPEPLTFPHPRIADDLATISLKCLEREPAKRYASADELAAELQRFLDHRPISARRPTLLEKLSKWKKRNPQVAKLSLTLGLVIGISGVVLWWQHRSGAEVLSQTKLHQALKEAEFAFSQNNSSNAMALLAFALREEPGNHIATRRALNTFKQRAFPLPLRQINHQEGVFAIAWSPNEKRFISGSLDGTAKIVSNEGTQVWTLHHAAGVTGVAFSPDGTKVATASSDKTAAIWNTATGVNLLQLKHPGPVPRVLFHPDNKRVLTSCKDGVARVWNLQTGEMEAELPHKGGLAGLYLNESSKELLTTRSDDGAWLWDLNKGELLNIFAPGELINSARWSPGETWVATGSDGGGLSIWEAKQPYTLLHTFNHTNAVVNISWSLDGTLLAASSGNQVHVRQIGKGKPDTLFSFTSETMVTSAEFGGNETELVIATSDGLIQIFDVVENRRIFEAIRHSDGVIRTQLSTSRDQLLATSNDGAVILWNLPASPLTKQTVKLINPSAMPIQNYTRKSKKRALIPVEKHMQLCDQNRNVLAVLSHGNSTINDAQFSQDEASVITGAADGTIKLWDAESGMPIADTYIHSTPIINVYFSNGDRQINAIDREQLQVAWSFENGRSIIPPNFPEFIEKVVGSRATGPSDFHEMTNREVGRLLTQEKEFYELLLGKRYGRE